MIKIYFNASEGCFEAYYNGRKIETINITIESPNMDLPKATITAFVDIVNEKPK